MKNEALYNKTVNILVQAYFNDTLEHSNCFACAIGNIIAANNGFEFEKKRPQEVNFTIVTIGWKHSTEWYGGSSGFQDNWTCINNPHRIPKKLKNEIDNTGYSFQQLIKIERAFEKASKCGDRMFNGLTAVIDVLDEIHDNKDTALTTASKQKFNKELLTNQ
jgi:hypothetical protein